MVDVVLRAGRLEADRQADAEPRAALRLHDAGLRGRQPHGELRSDGNGGRGAWCYASDGSLEDRALVKPGQEQLRAARRRRSTSIGERTLLRGGYGMFYNQFDRIGSEDQLALNPPGLRNIDVSVDVGQRHAGAAAAGRVPGELPRSVEPGDPQPDAARRRPRMRRARWSSSLAAASNGRSARHSSCRPTSSARSRHTLRCCATSTSRCRGTLDANGAMPVSGICGNIQWREMTGEANYKGVDFSLRETLHRRPTAIAPRYTIGEARDQAPEHLNASSGRPQNTRDLESWEGSERLRHPSSFRRQLHRRAAVRRGQADAAGRRRRRDARRLAGQRHLQRALRPRRSR